MSSGSRPTSPPPAPSSQTFFQRLRRALFSVRTGVSFPMEEPHLQSWDIPIEDSDPVRVCFDAPHGWSHPCRSHHHLSVFVCPISRSRQWMERGVREAEELRRNHAKGLQRRHRYPPGFRTSSYSCVVIVTSHALRQAGLFSAVLTTFVVATFDSLQEDYSRVTADALYHISQQLRDPTTSSLSSRTPFQPETSDVRVNMLWLISLVASLFAALLSILVKQWLAEYMTWTSMMSGKTAVALRQYRARGWDQWGVRHYRQGILVLLQLALVLFLCGLVDLLWNSYPSVAISTSAITGTTLGVWVFVTLMPILNAQCPYRSPVSWFFTWVFRQTPRMRPIPPLEILTNITNFVNFMRGGRFPTNREVREWILDYAASVAYDSRAYMSMVARLSWDSWDLRCMDDPAVVHSYAMDATAEVVTNFPSAVVLNAVSAGVFEANIDTGSVWLPVRGLWCLLEGLLGDDSSSRDIVLDKLHDSRIEELSAAGLPSEDFGRAVVCLVRRALRTQRDCSPRDVCLARSALDLSRIIAESEVSLLPCHATTLAWLLHDNTPNELVQVRATSEVSNGRA
jgi:hypothetical protein